MPIYFENLNTKFVDNKLILFPQNKYTPLSTEILGHLQWKTSGGVSNLINLINIEYIPNSYSFADRVEYAGQRYNCII